MMKTSNQRRIIMSHEHPQYINESQVAEMTGISLSTLRNQRFERRGMPYHKISRSVRYKLTDVVEYMDARRVETS